MENLLKIFEPTLLGKYWVTIVDNFSEVYLMSLGICFFLTIFTVGFTAKRRTANNKSDDETSDPSSAKNLSRSVRKSFEISPDDEVIFKSSLSQEELEEEIEKKKKSKYQPLDLDNPTRQIEEFLQYKAAKCLDSDDEDDDETMVEEKGCDLDSAKLISRVKKSRQEALRKQLESDMTEDDKLRERMIQQQQLIKIYSLLSENQDSFGSVSFNDVEKQMSMYQTS